MTGTNVESKPSSFAASRCAKDTPKGSVSVIIPARNASDSIGMTLNSLAHDRSEIFEIIVVDDDSSDGTTDVAVLTARESRLPLKVFASKAGNAGSSRNLGMDRAKGEFLFFLDADDELIAGGLIALVECIRSNPSADVAVGGYVRRSVGRKDKARLPHGYERGRMVNVHNYLSNELRSIAMGSALVRREALDGIQFPERLRFDEDTFFWAIVLTRSDVAAILRPVMIYNVGDERFIDRFTVGARKEFLKLAIEAKKLTAFGIDDAVIQWRKGWIALRIARAFIAIGDPVSARQFMRLARSHPRIRFAPTTLRYLARSWLVSMGNSIAGRFGKASRGRDTSSR